MSGTLTNQTVAAGQPIVLEFETYMEMPTSLTLVNECPGEFDPQKSNKMFGNALGHSYKLNEKGYKFLTSLVS